MRYFSWILGLALMAGLTGAVTAVPTAGDQPAKESAAQDQKDANDALKRKLKFAVQPKYPRQALKDKITGYVKVRYTVKADGTVDPGSITVIDASPEGVFEAATLRAVSIFKYEEAQEATPGVEIKIDFSLAE